MLQPNVIRGGVALPISSNLFLMKGRKHKNGGIDIGKDLEVEDNEVMQTSPKEIKVYSAQKFLGGQSPAELVLKGNNPDKVFEAQEHYKKVHKINDDGTKKKAKWGWFKKIFKNSEKDKNSSPVKGEDKINFNGLKLTNDRKYVPEYLDNIYNGLIKRGANKNQALTIIGTIAEESGGDVYALSKDKLFKGLLQWSDERYKIKYPDNREKELESQLDYMYDTIFNAQQRKDNGFKDDWTDGGEGSGYMSWKNAYNDFNDVNNAYNMTRGLNSGYVRPTGAIKGNKGSIINRLNVTKQLFENNGITNIQYEPSKKQYGGMKNNIIKSRISMYFPSTGVQKYKKGGRIKAEYGLLGNDYYKTMNLSFKKPNVSYNYGDITTYGDKNNSQKQNNDKSGLFSGLYWGTQGLNSLGQMVGGIIGASADYKQNMSRIKSQEEIIDKLQAPQEALTKLKTNFNINPQLSEVENRLGQTVRDIDANTSSSQTALNRKRNARLNTSLLKNQLFGQKENIETQIINQDRMQQAQTTARNVERESQYALTKANAKMQLEKEKAAAKSAKIQNITGSVLGGLGSLANAGLNYLQLGAGLAANPNSKKATFSFLNRAKFGKKMKLKKC